MKNHQHILVSCEHCGHKINGRIKFCPICGGECTTPVNSSKPICPHCRVDLKDHLYRGQNLAECPECNGLWLDFAGFDRLTTEADVYRDESVEPTFKRPPTPGLDGYYPCAKCGKLMLRKNFGGISDVMIDYCRDCGVWLDANELKSIRSFIASGGLEQAQDKSLTNHSTAIGLLDSRVDDLKFMEKVLHSRSLKRWFFSGF